MNKGWAAETNEKFGENLGSIIRPGTKLWRTISFSPALHRTYCSLGPWRKKATGYTEYDGVISVLWTKQSLYEGQKECLSIYIYILYIYIYNIYIYIIYIYIYLGARTDKEEQDRHRANNVTIMFVEEIVVRKLCDFQWKNKETFWCMTVEDKILLKVWRILNFIYIYIYICQMFL
jgi:hypothetical protein